MDINRKYIGHFLVELLVIFLLSTNAFTATIFYLLPSDSASKLHCDFLEIKSNQVLCTINNLLISYDTDHVKQIEILRNGKPNYYQNFTEDTISIINGINADRLATRRIKEQQPKKKILDFIPDSTQSLIDNFKIKSGNNLLNKTLIISGFIVFLIGSFAFLVATFRAGILWGISCMLLPFVSFIFLFIHWKTASKPFLLSMFGIVILFISTMFLPTAGTIQNVSKFNIGNNSDKTKNNNAKFQCDGKVYCSEMSSCAEAKFYLRNCSGTKIDGNNDGIPCEKQFCGN